MKISTYKCLITVFVVMILCQAAVALKQYDLLPCTERDSGGMLYCIEYDSMADRCYLHDNITRTMTIKLPIQVLTQLWLNQSAIVIVALIGEAINNGQELISSQDRDRWTIMFNFQQVNSDYGQLRLVIHIKDVKYRDMQTLHVEIRTVGNIFVTRSNIWFPVDVRPTDTSNDHEGEAEDPLAFLHARIETLQNKTEFLLEEKIAAENASIHYQTEYYHCLEAKDNLEGSTKPEFAGKGQSQIHLNIDIITLVIVQICTFGVAYIIFLAKRSKLASNAAIPLVKKENVSHYIDCNDEENSERQEKHTMATLDGQTQQFCVIF